MKFDREIKFYDFYRFSEKSVCAKIAYFFLKEIDLISLRIWILRPKLGRDLFFSIILGRRKTEHAILWNTLLKIYIFEPKT